jgi:predicted phage terminase large subunit-like protein
MFLRFEPHEVPQNLRIYGASDYATMEAKAGRDPDFSEHGVVGIDSTGDLWFIDWWSGQTETDKSIAAWIRLVAMHKPVRWWDEGGVIDKAIGPAKRDAMRRSQKFVHVEALPSIQDKAMKLQSFHARATAKTVHFPNTKWADAVIDQLVKFPAGRYDDKADVCGLIGRGVDVMIDARVPIADTRPILTPYTGAWLEWNDREQRPKERFF